jgi:capsular polysaccharide biosynthesis protein
VASSISDIKKYREFDSYELDIEIHRGQDVFIAAKIPSEPPEGITYQFGPSGYIGDPSSDYCVIPTTWRNVNNYCHWNFSELPYLFLAFESNVKNIVLPDAIIDSQLSFQKRWMELLSSLYPNKRIHRVSDSKFPKNALFPINHDTSASTKPIGKCAYKHYHHSRATPYLIDRVDREYKKHFMLPTKKFKSIKYIYINRHNRRLKNEMEVQEMLQEIGFVIVNLEDLTLDEQILVFANAKIIIGFHGAGLSNLLYANSSAKVFEIVDQDCVHPCYKDGIVIPGKKATRTYFHMLCEMKGIVYYPIESKKYTLDMPNFKNKLTTTMLEIVEK